MAKDDPILTTMRFIPKYKTVQKYDAILPDTLTNQAMKESDAYKTYYDFSSRKVIPKSKYVRRSTKEKTDQAPKASPEIALFEADQMKLITKRSKIQFHSSHASGSGEKEGTSVSPRVLDVPSYGSKDEQISWKSSDEDDDVEVSMSKDDEDNADNEDDDDQDDNEQTTMMVMTLSILSSSLMMKKRDTEMTNALLANDQATQVIEDTHLIIITITLEVQQQSSSVSSGFISKMLNPNPDTFLKKDVLVTTSDEIPPSYVTTLPPPPIPFIQPMQPTPVSTPKIALSMSLQNLPTFGSLFKFKDRVKSLEDDFLEFKQINLFAEAVSSIPSIVDKYLANQMNEAVKTAIQLQVKKRKARKEPESTSAPKDKTSKSTSSSKEGSKSKTRSTGKSAQAEEQVHTIKDLEEPTNQEFKIGFTEDHPVDETSQLPDWFQKPISTLAWNEDPRESFNELMDTPLDFSAFVLNRLKVDTLTPELLAGPTFDLMKGSCKSLVELEYFLEEVYKATSDQLDWSKPERQQYPHDLHKPLPLIPNSCGRRVIPFDHFINSDLAYLSDGVSSRMPIMYDEHTLWGISHWGRKHQHFYGFEVNRESARDVYSRHKIIANTKLMIVEWHNYKHLDWITVRKDDDKMYKFKEGDYKRLRLQDIKDMMLLLVQGKLKNLTIEEHLALSVSLRMFTRSIVIKRSVVDLQLGIKSCLKKLDLTKPDTYRLDLKRKTAYTTYSTPRGFIYQNKDKKNRLIRIDELYKFSDGTLNDVRSALDDILK
uniref:Retrovirus-related Pol polyprotein from transposon TNT 1-94 n=1 Tax=Tanacetum cinerariifolium TaxID=118510 RepID=A0A6L2K0M9_TANCI|nr:hypothetical protein [Tanacetum cinerariifolium]